MKKILFIDSTHPLLETELGRAGFYCEQDHRSSKEEIQNKVQVYYGIVIRSRFKIDKEFIDEAVNLKFIARAGAGMENIDIAYAESRGIRCFHAPDGNSNAVAEYALGMLLVLFRNIAKADAEVRAGKWIREANRGEELEGKTIGIIGYGNTGSAFAEKLRGFNVEILAYDKYKKKFGNDLVRETSLQEITEKADVVSFHIPLTGETMYMVNDAFINSFKKNIYLINTSRGKCLHTGDLVKNLRSGKVKGACLDVLEYESLSFETLEKDKLPEAFHYLAGSDKVVLSPHIAGWTFQSNKKMAKLLAQKIIALHK